MGKTRGKRNIAASVVPSMVEAVSGNDMIADSAPGNDMIAESAPSESVENNELAMTVILDKPEELLMKDEETKNGPDEAVDENEEMKDASNESREVENKIGPDESGEEESEDRPVEPQEDKTEESEDYFYESEDIDEIEESEDGLFNSEDEDGEEGTDIAVVKSDEEEKDAKEDENAIPMGTDVPEGKKFEEGAVLGTDAPGGEKVGEGAAIKEVKDLSKEGNTPKKKAKRIMNKKKKVAANDADKLSGADKQEAPAAVKKDTTMSDGTGLIFMCNAKTKMDCFRYKVFGLPARKKEMVAKIYKGMRLFLFDVDLKLLYGIYKAATPGGYNIEPKAFKSGFPSQVRFHVLNDCLPLPEEKFKAVIKGNYYSRNKFNCQLSPEQVKDLCKLFHSADKATNKKRPREVIRTETERISSFRDQKRACRERMRRGDITTGRRGLNARREAYTSPPPRLRDHAPRSRDVVRAGPERTYSSRKRTVHERGRRDNHIPRGRDQYSRIEVYSSPPPRALALPPSPLPLAYGRLMDDYYYTRDAPLLDRRDRRVVDLETRPVEPLGYRDPYSLYGEPLSREAGYVEPLSREAGYRERLPRDSRYTEPVLYEEELYPTSSTRAAAAAPRLYYRY